MVESLKFDKVSKSQISANRLAENHRVLKEIVKSHRGFMDEDLDELMHLVVTGKITADDVFPDSPLSRSSPRSPILNANLPQLHRMNQILIQKSKVLDLNLLLVHQLPLIASSTLQVSVLKHLTMIHRGSLTNHPWL